MQFKKFYKKIYYYLQYWELSASSINQALLIKLIKFQSKFQLKKKKKFNRSSDQNK